MKRFKSKTFVIKRNPLLLGVSLWWGLFVVLSITQFNPLQILNIVGFSFLILVPGFLTVLLLKLRRLEFWSYLGLTIGFSLLELMVFVLICNTILPLIGIQRPLDKPALLVEITSLVGLLLGLVWFKVKKFSIKLREFVLYDKLSDLIFGVFPIIFVLLSVLGATTLNNGGNGNITLTMLVGLGIYSILLIRRSYKSGLNVIPTGLFFTSLSLLLMTSLRGWYTSGHDVETEFRVFQLAKNSGVWSISSFRDAYNACMSITILPTIFDNLLSIFDPNIYKVLFQIIFAIVPSVIYLITKRYVAKAVALISTIYFIAFPTFSNDMPMLNRQEIAFVFLSLMSYLIFEKRIPSSKRRFIFLLFGFGMVLSHYSTTYSVMALLTFVVIFRPLVRLAGMLLKRRKFLTNSGISLLHKNIKATKGQITFLMVFLIAASSFLWSSVLTNTSSGSLNKVITQTLDVIVDNTKKDARSGDVLYGLFSWKQLNETQEFEEYQNNVVTQARAKYSSEELYDPSLFEKIKINTTDQDKLPLTGLGEKLNSIGINISSLNFISRQITAKLLQILIILGFVHVLIKNWFLKKLVNTELLLLSIGSLIFVLSIVVLPVLSVQYGLLRAFQQSLMFLGGFVTIGSLFLVSRFKKSRGVRIAGLIAVIFMWIQTGVFSQILGGYYGQFNLANSGSYYDNYYFHTAEVSGIDWMSKNIAGGEHQPEIQADHFFSTKIESVSQFHTLHNIYPEVILKYSYVFLGYQNARNLKVPVSYNGNTFTYSYPIEFLDENKDLVYSSNDVRIYK